MQSKNEFKKIIIENCMRYYLDDIMKVGDLDFIDISLNEKSYKTHENILIYGISYKSFMGAKLLLIRFGKIDGFIKTYGGIRYLVLFTSERYDKIYDRTRYLISKKSGITDIISQNFARIRIDSCNSVPIKNTRFS